MRTALLAATILAASSLAAGAQPFANPQGAVDRMMAATEAQDAAAMAGLYSEGALLLIPGQPVVEGRDRIEAQWRTAYADGFRELRIATPENRRRSEGAASVYQWAARVQQGDRLTVLRARTLLFLEQVEGGWLIGAEMWQPVPDAP